MGLCKCPKRQVTNQFCFEHRVNVCENCLIQSHQKCIVQSYLQWLKDSDYVSNCTLCSSSLEQGDCVRLVCYHVFHWDCLNAKQAALPATTTPRGHLCPLCDTEIFPAPNLVSPVAEVLKQYLSKVNWGRNGLGLALLPEDQVPRVMAIRQQQNPTAASVSNVTKVHHSSNERGKTNGTASGNIFASSTLKQDTPHSVLLMDTFNPPNANDIHASSRRNLLPRQPPIGGADRDDNKYRRRTTSEVFSRWSRRFYAPSSRPPWRRTWFLVATGILAFIVLIYFMALFGRGNSGDDLDDTWANPNPKQMMHYD